MPNARIFYSCLAVGLAPYTTPTAYMTLRGIQSAGVNTKFNLEQAFELGNIQLYEQIENVPEVEVTLEKDLDGYTPIYCLATSGAPSATLVGRSNQRANVALVIYPDTGSLASGTPYQQCIMSGCYVSQESFSFNVQGFFKESTTMVGNNKIWLTGSYTFNGFTSAGGVTSLAPAAPEGINRRQHFNMPVCRFPRNIPGISSSGTNDALTAEQFGASIQNVKVSVNLGREELLELGRRVPYFRYVNFPVEVSTSIEIIDKTGDLISATETGVYANGANVVPYAMRFKTSEGLGLDLGTQNMLNGVTMSGANAGGRGGNSMLTFNYQNFDDFTVTHTADPTGFTPGF